MTDSTDGCIFRTSPAHETQPFYLFLGLDGVATNSWIWFCLYSILLFIFYPSTFFSPYFSFPFFSTRSPIPSWQNPAIDLTQPMSTFRLQCIYCKLFLSVVLFAHVPRKDLLKGKKKKKEKKRMPQSISKSWDLWSMRKVRRGRENRARQER